jgi:hypothetical protein
MKKKKIHFKDNPSHQLTVNKKQQNKFFYWNYESIYALWPYKKLLR